MNKAKLKSYAPQARKDFIAAVEARANLLGLSEKNGTLDISASEKKGDVAVISGQAWPAKVHDQRQRLIKRMKKDGFAQTIEAVAYTWFNRFAALRFMEVHDYLGHGHRVLSSREGGLPEIIAHATEVTGSLPGLNAAQVADMKLAGNKDGELYRLLLVAQCNALSNAMPFLFERIDDESELLLPGNLERTDSVIAKLVEAIAEEDWSEIEVIGWLYQFYISEKKDAVIGKVVKSEDIPAATQLFTPNWIVQYLVQNSVGRLWLMANPASTLKSQWPYYIEPAEQAPEVQAQLDELIQTRMAEDGGSLNPETITVLDPACGSGHILVEAYEVLKVIYLERGYQARAIPRLILEKNLFGLDIDDRAAQMAGFALMMKARSDDRRLLETPIKLNVLSLQESRGLELDELDSHLKPFGISRALLASLIDTFAHAKTFGSLIQISEALASGFPVLVDGLGKAIQSGDVFSQASAQDLLPLVAQATVLATKFDAVAANPPYMGSKGMNAVLKAYAQTCFPASKSDLFAMFIERAFGWCKLTGFNSMVTMQSWMFLSSFEAMRNKLLGDRTLSCMVHMGNGVMGIAFGTAATVLMNKHVDDYLGSFSYCDNANLGNSGIPNQFPVQNERLKNARPDDFKKIPGSPIAYWASPRTSQLFSKTKVGAIIESQGSVKTGDNDRYIRAFWEVSISSIGATSRWRKHPRGGEYRKWYGNVMEVVDWGSAARSHYRADHVARIPDEAYWDIEGICWSEITSANTSFRVLLPEEVANNKSLTIYPTEAVDQDVLLGFLNTHIVRKLLSYLNPTIGMGVGDVTRLPWSVEDKDKLVLGGPVKRFVTVAREDWDSYERSWDFQSIPIMTASFDSTPTLASSYTAWITQNRKTITEIKHLEEENNRLFIDAYGLKDELTPDVPIEQITLTVNPAYRYGANLTEEEQWTRFRQDTMAELISYAIGCMMGRYSLDDPGLIYANAGNIGFDFTRYKTFPADTDGIIPITNELWFDDDASNRVREFMSAVWGSGTLDENMAWLAEGLGRKGNETPDEIIRRYLSGSFYKDHLQTYKRRPIYWQFSSGKQGAFQALVYLHRYHEGTLARIRAEYVVPLTGKMQSRIEMLDKDRDAASSTASRNRIAKQIESLKKKHVELLAYDEKLRHYADMRIQLDLDDGVKVNYGKFGDLLAEVKAVTGGAGDD